MEWVTPDVRRLQISSIQDCQWISLKENKPNFSAFVVPNYGASFPAVNTSPTFLCHIFITLDQSNQTILPVHNGEIQHSPHELFGWLTPYHQMNQSRGVLQTTVYQARDRHHPRPRSRCSWSAVPPQRLMCSSRSLCCMTRQCVCISGYHSVQGFCDHGGR